MVMGCRTCPPVGHLTEPETMPVSPRDEHTPLSTSTPCGRIMCVLCLGTLVWFPRFRRRRESEAAGWPDITGECGMCCCRAAWGQLHRTVLSCFARIILYRRGLKAVSVVALSRGKTERHRERERLGQNKISNGQVPRSSRHVLITWKIVRFI